MVMEKGIIHSIESLGAADGPGLRFVVFFAGCPMRCAYCHNPDTWEMKGTEMSADEILAQCASVRQFLKGGGITCTGGEPLLQSKFLSVLFEKAKKDGLHTCLDTSGAVWGENTKCDIDRILDNTDLVMLDIKHIDPIMHKKLTGQDNSQILNFALHLGERGIPVRIRHVLVPGITDDTASLLALGEFIGQIRSLREIEVLPYHTLGVMKYSQLGLDYPLKGLEAATKARAARAKRIIFEGVKQGIKKRQSP